MIDATLNAGALVLAAGKGTRMRSDKPKVLHAILGEPMLWYIHRALDGLGLRGVWTVIGHGADMVRAAFPDVPAEHFVMQTAQLGTGHALSEAWPALEAAGLDYVLVANGDTPLVPSESLERLVRESVDAGADVAFMSLTLDDPGAYGRVVRDAEGRVRAIVEAKDFDPAVHGGEVREINAGIYWLRMSAVADLLPRLSNTNASGEFYITDLVSLAVADGLVVTATSGGRDPQLLGVNSPAELVRSEELIRSRIVDALLNSGVCIHSPSSAVIGPRAQIAPGCELHGPCEIYGATRVASGTSIASHCWITDCVIGEGTQVKPFSHLERSTVGNGCQVGPYARLRPQAVMCDESKVGNFVEMKKAVLGHGSKASHLTYLGDTEVGTDVNIGAGTITCNYDGVNKHKTTICDRAFIGSNTALVAPVTVGEGALVGAGSVITRDVSPKHLAVTRAKQVELPRRK
ncbi:bifunctional UDP-N-acetylglucosamine pyrophosphorylase/glucosamine-1-phosphate N-acetyltransferase [Desulfobaculum xiamenense]|uniref:Bifunctional protein GlmU n=1 Tax=Desulfobaculum xiamenense TaxID=995050 RepID=A0A846QRX7_9BACT|nr:bifunctional UDP-N-acetylglucosamine diphosphorylase/glucosamine-1-phosphate N-acetyltransferase GlmU [Desulfobaculum xiamenense]NJB68175.1 bifunctional UDP-N-acetylglucosamine pyrophosphorylase/glucosamine-1-phosphate N-acetyltransferase [Desulfobaculum xiamenense]